MRPPVLRHQVVDAELGFARARGVGGGVFVDRDFAARVFGQAQNFPQLFAVVHIPLRDRRLDRGGGLGHVQQGDRIRIGADLDLREPVARYREKGLGQQDRLGRDVHKVIGRTGAVVGGVFHVGDRDDDTTTNSLLNQWFSLPRIIAF